MIIYCDRLSLRSLARILGFRLVGARAGSEWVVRLLDEPPQSGAQRGFCRLLRLAGIKIGEVDFHAGSMYTSEGDKLPWAATSLASDLVMAQAEVLLSRSSTLRSINDRWGRRTVELRIAKRSYGAVRELVLRILVASHLARSEKDRSVVLLHRPRFIGSQPVCDTFADVDLRLCGQASDWGARIHSLSARISRRIGAGSSTHRAEQDSGVGVSATGESPMDTNPAVPGVLVLQRDDLGADRSYRTQPHWLFSDGDRPEFQTYVLGTSYVRRTPPDSRALDQLGVTILESLPRFLPQRSKEGRIVLARLVVDAARCAFGFLIRSGELRTAFRTTFALLLHAWALGRLCRALNIRVFVSGEGFLRETDAMQLVGPPLGVATVGYQYSNLPRSHVIMLQTSTTFLSFSEACGDVFGSARMGPQGVVANGYPYDSSFELLEERAASLRKRLEAAGATFVVCFFDETITPGRYGSIHPSEHRADLETLITMVAEDPTIALVIKTQYRRHAPSRLYAGHPRLRAVMDSNRYLELSHGSHRNTVFPAEAALAADVAIGHIFGATASLEAALAGRRSLLLNEYGFKGVHDHVYERAEIVFSSLGDALEAVRRYRAGDPAHAELGDWTPILDYFDPFRDGNSGRRMRSLLNELVFNSGDRLSLVDAGAPQRGDP